jgi:2-methylisocitrate lyase-like PEP mutase family enzyme
LKKLRLEIKAGADGIMIHSKEKEVNEIKLFLKKYNKFKVKVPIIVVPSTYAYITEKELASFGVSVVIYANQLLRSAYPAMKNTAELILKHQRALEASDENCMPIKEILTLIPGTK